MKVLEVTQRYGHEMANELLDEGGWVVINTLMSQDMDIVIYVMGRVE